jgi:hypothetical protein
VLLLAVQGVRYPVAAFMGAVGLAAFPALYEVTGHPSVLTSVELLGPGIAAIAMAYRPQGSVFYAGRTLATFLPWRKDARDERAVAIVKQRSEDVTRDEINDLGLKRPFTIEKVAQLDRALHVADALLERPGVVAGTEEVADGTPVG